MSARFIDRKVHVVEERYTSKTCSCCGWIDHNLGSAKIFKCQRSGCGRVMDRDSNASLNILLKHVERYVGRVIDRPNIDNNSNNSDNECMDVIESQSNNIHMIMESWTPQQSDVPASSSSERSSTVDIRVMQNEQETQIS